MIKDKAGLIGMKMTEAEGQQMTGMINWAEGLRPTQKIELSMFKQYRNKTKCYHTMFEVTSIEWRDGMWKIIRGNGDTVTEAMKNYSAEWSKVK